MITIHAKDALYIKRKDIPSSLREAIKKKYTFRFYEESACKKCEYYDERMEHEDKHLDICGECSAFLGGSMLATDVKVKKNQYLKTPIGDRKGLVIMLRNQGIRSDVEEHFPDKKFRRPIKFTGTFRGPYQKEAANAIIKSDGGVVKAPPRSGKTVIASAAICKIGKKTLIMASQIEWLNGFKETFIGSPTQVALSDCRPSQIGLCKKYEDFLKYDICLVTVQTLYNERLLGKIKNLFTNVVVDEVHTGAAPKYARVLSVLNCQRKIGLSGTPSRKDGRFVIMRNLVGPVIYEAKVERLRPTIKLVRTEYVKVTKGQVRWTSLVSGLEKDPKRLKLIAQWAIKDAKDGHMVLIPLTQVTPIKALVKAINIIAGKTLAYPFWGGLSGKMMYKGKMTKKRDVYINAARNYKIKILVGNIKLLSTGTNIPRASAIYEVALSSNKENCEQRISRVLTPWDDKPNPIVRIFLDDMAVRRRCLQNEFFNVMKPVFKPIMRGSDMEVLTAYFSNRKQHERMVL
jgi:superfamily II DNA or RNA helicase